MFHQRQQPHHESTARGQQCDPKAKSKTTAPRNNTGCASRRIDRGKAGLVASSAALRNSFSSPVERVARAVPPRIPRLPQRSESYRAAVRVLLWVDATLVGQPCGRPPFVDVRAAAPNSTAATRLPLPLPAGFRVAFTSLPVPREANCFAFVQLQRVPLDLIISRHKRTISRRPSSRSTAIRPMALQGRNVAIPPSPQGNRSAAWV